MHSGILQKFFEICLGGGIDPASHYGMTGHARSHPTENISLRFTFFEFCYIPQKSENIH